MVRPEKPKPLLAQRLKQLTPRPIRAFAKKLGINPARYYAYIAGERPPDAVLAVIASHLGVSMDDLLASDDYPGRIGIPVVGRATAGNLAFDPSKEGWTEVTRLRVADMEIIVRRRPAAAEVATEVTGGP